MSIHHWHIVIGGYRQHEGKPTGMVRLWQTLHERHARPGTCVELRAWNDQWRLLAELIWRLRPDDEPPQVKVYAYSWGAGCGAMRLARELRLRGIAVAAMVLSDPVYRSRSFLTRWLALWPCAAIVVPANVRLVRWFRQEISVPAGHVLRAAERERTHIAPPIWAEVGHQYMDDWRPFHRECERIAAL
jgi:hypothetical protein